MKLSKGKFILIIVVIYFGVFAVININKEKNINKQILKKVTYVTNGKLDKANEGKLVLVSGKISYDKLVSFSELDNDFGTIKIKRKVEDYIKYYDESTSRNKYKWQERKELLENSENDFLKQLVSEEKNCKIRIGDYELDQYGLSLIPTNKYYSRQESIGGLTTTGIDYTRDPWEENLEEGDIKLTYQYYDIDKNPYISVLAIQKDNTFIPYKVDKKNEVYQLFVGKVTNEKELSKQLKINIKKTVKGKTLFILMIIGVGIFLIVDNKKNKKSL